MDKKDVIEFFNGLAASWDAELVRSDEIIGIILDNGGIKEGVKVLDIKTPRLIQFNYSSADFAA